LPASDIIHYSDHIDQYRKDLFKLIQNKNIEGIVGKNKYSPYILGIRTSQWLKIKSAKESEAVVAGILLDEEQHGRTFSSLIIGARGEKKYKYIGLVEAGIK
jgi:bifunctional non-homologous end joining protein LigD